MITVALMGEFAQEENQAWVRIAPAGAFNLTVLIVGLLLPAFDGAAVDFCLGGFDALLITNLVALDLGVLEILSPARALFELPVKVTDADPRFFNGRMGLHPLSKIFNDTLEAGAIEFFRCGW